MLIYTIIINNYPIAISTRELFLFIFIRFLTLTLAVFMKTLINIKLQMLAVYIQLQNIIIVLSFKKEKVQYCVGLEIIYWLTEMRQ